MAFSPSCSVSQWRILLRAREVLTTVSQSRLGGVSGLRDDFHDIAVFQFGLEWNHPAVDFCSDTGVSDLGVNGVGKIDRRRIARERDDFALRV
jgi:hypothetical protein